MQLISDTSFNLSSNPNENKNWVDNEKEDEQNNTMRIKSNKTNDEK